MEEEAYTREPTSGDRLRRYNSTTMSLLRRRDTGKADLAVKVQLAGIDKEACVLCTYVCAYRHLIMDRNNIVVHKRYLQKIHVCVQ